MNSTRLEKIGPCIKSTFIWKKRLFRGRVWVIGFLQLYFYRKTTLSVSLPLASSPEGGAFLCCPEAALKPPPFGGGGNAKH